MPFSRIANFQFKPGTLDKAVSNARDNLVPLFQKIPGFLSYTITKGPGDRGCSVATFQTREQAETALKQAEQWLQVNTRDIAVSKDIYLAEVAYTYDSMTAPFAAKPNVPVIEAVYAAFNEKEIERVTGLLEPKAKVTNVAFGVELPVVDYMKNWATAFPDGKIEATNFIEGADGVLAEFIGRGTQTGTLQTPMGPIAPTGKKVEIHFAEIYKFRSGKISSVRVYFNAAAFLRQLGISPDLTAPPPAKTAASQPEVRH